jgi:hypothetical protein
MGWSSQKYIKMRQILKNRIKKLDQEGQGYSIQQRFVDTLFLLMLKQCNRLY